jgi:flagellar P-ring protein precursor FlgI
MARRFFLIFAVALALLAAPARAQKISDICRLVNADALHVEGLGMVVGLKGTGDTSNNAKVMLQKLFAANDFNFSIADLNSKNIAIVRLEAEIKPFARPGEKIPVRVSSLGNATSLRDGTLKATALKFRSEDKEAQVWATGRVLVGETATIGIIDEGGAVLTAPLLNRTIVNKDGFFQLALNNPSYMDAMTIERNLNTDPKTNPHYQAQTGFGDDNAPSVPPVAKARDAGLILVRIPDQFLRRQVDYIAAVLDAEVPIESVARIRINRSNGSAVITGNIGIKAGFITYRGRTVTLNDPGENQPPVYDMPNDTPRALVDLLGYNGSGGTGRISLQTLVETLSAMRCTTEDVINILTELKRADAIQAELIVD